MLGVGDMITSADRRDALAFVQATLLGDALAVAVIKRHADPSGLADALAGMAITAVRSNGQDLEQVLADTFRAIDQAELRGRRSTDPGDEPR